MADLLQAYQAGAQLGLQRRAQDTQASQFNRTFEQNAAMQALHAESTKLINTERGLDIQLKFLAKQRELQILDAESQAAQIMLDSPNYELGAADPEIQDRVSKLMKGVPGLAGRPLGQALLANSRAAIDWFNGEAHAKANHLVPVRETVGTLSGGTATFGLPETATAGPSTEFERNLATLPPDEQTRLRQMSALKAASPNKQDYLELRDARKAAVTAGDLEEVKAIDLRLAFLNKSGDSTTAGTASNGIPLTTARVTELQKDKATVQETIAAGLATLPRWGAGTTGPGATMRRVAGATLGQVFESAQSQDVAQMDISAATFKTLAVKLLKTDSQIAEAERTALEKTIPSPGMALPAETASWKQQQLMLYTIKRGKRVADNLGEEFDPVSIAHQVRSAVEASGQPVIDEFKTIDELTTEMRVKGQGKSKSEHIALSTQYSRKIKESVFYTASTATPPPATTPLPRRPLRK